MNPEKYCHPALKEISTQRIVYFIADAIIFASSRIQIISAISSSEKNFIFISRKLFDHEIQIGVCYKVSGEDRHTSYYGDIFIARAFELCKAPIEIFYIYACYNFPFLRKSLLKRIIETHREDFLDSISKRDATHLIEKMSVPPYIATKLIEFSVVHLRHCHETL